MIVPLKKRLPNTVSSFVIRSMILGAGIFLVTGCSQYIDEPQVVAPMILEEAETTLRSFRGNPDLKEIDTHIPDAAGILIFPRVVKGGLIAGVEAGTGVLLARTDTGWSAPAFYLLTAGSLGLQAGLQENEIVMIIRNQGALNAVIEHQGKFGAELGIMVGWTGIGYEGATTTSLGLDILAYSGDGFGVFGGAALEGAALVRRNDLNDYLYGEGSIPRAIVLEGRLSNPVTDSLRAAISPR